jgi:(p)ppGpp synthase/HD superfamily hydrolase
VTLLENAEALARRAHAGQYRRDKRTPYLTHVERVVARLRAQGVTDEETLATAWLHDVIEDGVFVWRTLELAKVPDCVIETVMVLTKPLGKPYQDYITVVSANPTARLVKIADILDNLSDTPTDRQIVNYAKALITLHPRCP